MGRQSTAGHLARSVVGPRTMGSEPKRDTAPLWRRRHRRTVELLDRGDRACQHAEAEALAIVARTLIPEVPRALRFELVAVAELAFVDLVAARARWQPLSDRLHAHAEQEDTLAEPPAE